MSITPVGGWNDLKEGEVVPKQVHSEHSVFVVHREENRQSTFTKAFLGCLGVFCAFWVLTFTISFVGGFVRALSTAIDTNHPAPIVDNQPTVYTVTASRLNHDYEANEPAADIKYAGKILSVSGNVRSIDKDAFGTIHVVLQDADMYSYGTLLGVGASINNNMAENSIATTLHRDQAVTVTCTKVERIIGSVALSNCDITSY